MKRRDISVLMASLAALGTANAQFGNLGGMLGGRSGGGGASIDSIIGDFLILGKSCAICSLQLGYAFSTRESAAQFQEKAKQISGMSQPKELGAALTDVQKSTDATVQGLADADKAVEAYNKLTPQMQKFVASALLTAGIGALKVVDIVKKVQNANPSPMDVPKLVVLKEPLEVISKTTPQIWDRGLAMLKKANVSPPTPDKEAKIEASADGWPQQS
jgi:hypothetical protein